MSEYYTANSAEETATVNIKKIWDWAWLCAVIAIVLLYAILAFSANTDLIAGRFALYMDERITFDGVRHILHPESLKDWLLSVVHGGDHRYGRSLWNSIALFSAIPEYFFGERGQIIAARMTQVTLLLSAYLVLIVSFLRGWFMRFCMMGALLSMPYTSYYMSMPKPEPLQVLLIAIFLVMYKKANYSLASPYWVLLGLAFGTKFSTLPLIPVFILLPLQKSLFDKGRFLNYLEGLLIALMWVLIGLALAVPILSMHIIISIALFFLILRNTGDLRSRFGVYYSYLIVLAVGVLNVVVGAGLYKVGVKSGLTTWIGSTLLNTTHGSDRPEVWFGSWVKFFVSEWLIVPFPIAVILIAIGGLYFLKSFIRRSHQPFALMLVVAGVVLNLSVMLAAHRLWGMYLFPGTILVITGLLVLLEEDFIACGEAREGVSGCIFSRFVLILVLAVVSIWWVPNSILEYRDLASRTKSKEYVRQYRSYVTITDFLAEYSKDSNSPLVVFADPNLFLPESTEDYTINEFWGPFTLWNERPDVIIFSSRHTDKRISIPKNALEYKAFELEREGYSQYVVDDKKDCLGSLCYRKSIDLPNGGVILSLIAH